jgi:hypothetical protein
MKVFTYLNNVSFYVFNLGHWQSTSTGRYEVNGITRQYQLEQAIMYEECQYNTEPRLDVTRLMTSRNYLSYEGSQNIVRYIMTAKVGVSQTGTGFLFTGIFVLVYVCYDITQ